MPNALWIKDIQMNTLSYSVKELNSEKSVREKVVQQHAIRLRLELCTEQALASLSPPESSGVN